MQQPNGEKISFDPRILEDMMRNRNITVSKLSILLGVHQHTVRNWLNHQTFPSRKNMASLEHFLHYDSVDEGYNDGEIACSIIDFARGAKLVAEEYTRDLNTRPNIFATFLDEQVPLIFTIERYRHPQALYDFIKEARNLWQPNIVKKTRTFQVFERPKNFEKDCIAKQQATALGVLMLVLPYYLQVKIQEELIKRPEVVAAYGVLGQADTLVLWAGKSRAEFDLFVSDVNSLIRRYPSGTPGDDTYVYWNKLFGGGDRAFKQNTKQLNGLLSRTWHSQSIGKRVRSDHIGDTVTKETRSANQFCFDED